MNSIEEDITKIEGLKYLTLQATINEKFICAKIPEDYIQAIEHILSDYKRVLKENEQLRTEMNSLKKDISNMYDEEVIISIISDNFNLSRNEVLELLGGE